MTLQFTRILSIQSAVTLTLAVVATSCAVTYSGATYTPEQLNRRVVDAETGQGIAGALVVFGWTRRQVDIGHGASTQCVRLELARAGSEGKYKVPDWQGLNGSIWSIFQRGYVEVNDPVARSKGIDKLSIGSDEFSKRTEELGRSLVRCSESEDRKLLVLYEALYQDAMNAAKTSQEKRTVERYFLSPIDEARYGMEEARRRAHEREIQR